MWLHFQCSFVFNVALFSVQSRVRTWLHIWWVAWKRGPSSPCPCRPRLTILYRLMSTKCVRHHGSFRVAVVVAKRLLRNTTRGRLHLTVGRVPIPPSPPITRAKFTIQYIFTVSQKSGIPDQLFVFLLAIFDLIFKLGLTTFPVGPKSGGSSDTSPPLQSFAEES